MPPVAAVAVAPAPLANAASSLVVLGIPPSVVPRFISVATAKFYDSRFHPPSAFTLRFELDGASCLPNPFVGLPGPLVGRWSRWFD